VHGMEAIDVPILIEPAARDLADSYDQIEQLGRATGHSDQAAALVGSTKREIASIVASVPRPSEPMTVYHELDDTYYSATSSTFIGQVYTMLGVRNIADRAPAGASDYPQLSAEYIIRADPDLIVLADTKCCGQDPGTVAARPGWDEIAAVRDGEVIPVDDDIASRWGPRIVEFVRTIATHVVEAEHAISTPSGAS
jgi:iron complex transport system substrate-binding protein